MKKYLIIHGPNLNLLGKREPEIYGSETLDEINKSLQNFAEKNKIEIITIQSNHEGAIIDAIHDAIGKFDGIVINPGAFTHYSIAIYDAITSTDIPTIEVHLSNIYSREEFRRHSVIAPACRGQITGMGWYGYIFALKALIND